MNKYIIQVTITLFTLFISSCNPAIIEKNELEIVDVQTYFKNAEYQYWSDTIPNILYYPTGNIKVKYDRNERVSFYKNGLLQSKAKAIRKYLNDTTWQINAVTLEDEQIVINGIWDHFIGKYLEFEYLTLDNYAWKDTTASKQTKYWKNGNIKTEYFFDSKNNKIRKDYNRNNIEIRKAIVKEVYSIDTTWQINAITLEEKMIVKKGYTDSIINILFFKEPSIIIKGQYFENKKIGNWFFKKKDKIVELKFENNKIKNIYNEYFINSDFSDLKIKSKGFIKEIMFTTTEQHSDNQWSSVITIKHKKDGLWQYYDTKGEKTNQVYYNNTEDTLKINSNAL